MLKDSPDRELKNPASARDHLANERTFLAWVRTSIGIMAFGFVVEKFALFVKQIAIFLGPEHLPAHSHLPSHVQGYSSIFGVALVSFGAILCLLAYCKYRVVEREIESDTYQSSTTLNTIVTFSVLLMGIFLITYLVNSF